MTKSEIQKLVEEIQVTRYIDYKDYLKSVYLALKNHFNRYSYIRFTEDVGLGQCNAMYLIIHGQRSLTIRSAKIIVQSLGLAGIDRQYFLKLVEVNQESSSAKRDQAFENLLALKAKNLPKPLDQDQLSFYSEWYHGAILELLGQEAASDDPQWLAKTLIPGITPTKAKESLNLLSRLGLIRFSRSLNRMVANQKFLGTGPEVVGMAVISYHQQMIQLAKESLTRMSPYERNISSVTISLSKLQQEKLKEKLDEFRKEIIKMESGNTQSSDVIQMNLQMFPIAKSGKGTK